MEIVLVILAFVLFLVGLLGTFLPALPGPPISYAGLLVLQWSGYGEFTVAFLIIWAVITVIVTVMDYILPSIMTKKFGGSKAASIGSVIGLIFGLFIFPPWGILAGLFCGALIGELIHSKKMNSQSVKAAFGALLSFFVGTGIKLIACSMMLFFGIRAMF